MSGKVIEFSAAFDVAYVLKHDLERILCHTIPRKMFTDSKKLLYVIKRASHTTEKRLMIDVATVLEAYNSFDITNVGFVAGTNNLADRLTNPKSAIPSTTYYGLVWALLPLFNGLSKRSTEIQTHFLKI